MYQKGYCFWRRHTDGALNSGDFSEDAVVQHKLWVEYLKSAGGLRELLVADTRSVQPGLWNDRWELPWPYINRPRHVAAFPRGRMTSERAAAEVAARIAPLRARVDEILGRTSSLFGYQALVSREYQDRLHRARYYQ